MSSNAKTPGRPNNGLTTLEARALAAYARILDRHPTLFVGSGRQSETTRRPSADRLGKKVSLQA